MSRQVLIQHFTGVFNQLSRSQAGNTRSSKRKNHEGLQVGTSDHAKNLQCNLTVECDYLHHKCALYCAPSSPVFNSADWCIGRGEYIHECWRLLGLTLVPEKEVTMHFPSFVAQKEEVAKLCHECRKCPSSHAASNNNRSSHPSQQRCINWYKHLHNPLSKEDRTRR